MRVTVWETPSSFASYTARELTRCSLVFDLDGTLIDSRRDLAESANELLAAYGAAPLAEEAVGRHGRRRRGVLVARVLAARELQAPQAEALARYLAIYDRRLLDHTVPYDGIDDVLRRAGPRRGWLS